ncbi:Initiation-specific alpha-1,6-mannosyltransferase [Neolecta irregularis DAH-3]|uniref:Initiation-specific alpha-1,6-mannosyltransferase n=1 Tax=Neolecta irregularis (strain DAH-3) TaxID=1198029 RepID=A0A1U7LQA7_NEOID|nr:Initiation-specific alpha-1,6-mannosyltransferase [Neolecta irregularis DAH-3]|eukprot:OLL24808.1 Initiation-specific alpha-1,6-mannosyltransferase [Neolecta irregularis DAH-3]
MRQPGPRRIAIALVVCLVMIYFFYPNSDLDFPSNPTSVRPAVREPPIQKSPRKRPKTQPILKHYQTLRENLEYQFPYDISGMFPTYIWQTWKFSPNQDEFDERLREPEASWTGMHPGFIHEVIDDKMAAALTRHLFSSTPEVIEAYNALPLPILKADFFRYLILLARGGIYSDIDTAALKPAKEWIPSTVSPDTVGMVIGIESDPDLDDWEKYYVRRIQFCQWTIRAKPGHPILREVVARISEEVLSRKSLGTLLDVNDVLELTGPGVWTDSVYWWLNQISNGQKVSWENFTAMRDRKHIGDILVLPITGFSPGVRTMGAEDDDHPMAMVKHYFEGSWREE